MHPKADMIQTFKYMYSVVAINDIVLLTYMIFGNLILNWPKLLQPFKTVSHLILMCMCSQGDSTSLSVQRSQIFFNFFLEQFKHAIERNRLRGSGASGRCLQLAPYLQR